MSAVLEVRELQKTFGGIAAVDGVSFDVHEGEILGIIGPNGSGKSTLFNCILGQLAPTAGDVHLDGRAGDRHAALRSQPARREPHLPAPADVSAAHRARQSDPRRPGAPRHDALAPVRPRATPGLAAAADRMIEFFRLEHLADEQGRRPELRPAEAARRRDGVHGGAAPRAARRAGRRRQPDDAGEPARPAEGDQRRAARDLRRHRAQHGIRHGAVLAASWCWPRAASSRRASRRRSAAIRK